MTHAGKVHDWLVLPFQCAQETIELRFCLMPAMKGPRAGYQVEMHHL
jgi:hypothetical protein